MADPVTEVVGQIEVDGTYVMTSAQRDQVALILPGEEHTAFTGRLLELLRSGIPGGPEILTIDDFYRHLLVTMKAEGLPQPQKRATRTADLLALAQNRAHPKISASQPSVQPRRAYATCTPEQIRVARGIRDATQRIARVLGPTGRKCMVRDNKGLYIEAADATTIVEHFNPEDPSDLLGATYVRDLVHAQKGAAHDGAATAAVLARAMISRAMDALRNGSNPVSLKRGIDTGVAQVRQELSNLAREVELKQQIVALVATSTRDAAIGEMIAEAMDMVGKEGAITLEESNTFGLELELTDGMRFDKGYISPYFVTDQERMEAVLEDPYILIVNSKISANRDLVALLDKVVTHQPNGSLVIIARDLDGEALATLIVNKMRDIFKSIAVTAPGTGDHRKAVLADIAIMTGAQVIGDGSSVTLENAELGMLGRARKVVVSQQETTIIGGAGAPDQISGRVDKNPCRDH